MNLCLHHKFVLDRRCQFSSQTCREWFQCFKSGDFDVEDRHGGGKEKIFGDSELEALIAEDSCQTQEELVESLEVTQQAISKHLKAMGMIQMQENLVPYELKSINIERRSFSCEQLLQRQNRKGLLYCIVIGSTTIIRSAESHGDCPEMPSRRRPDRILTVPRLCSAFGETSSV